MKAVKKKAPPPAKLTVETVKKIHVARTIKLPVSPKNVLASVGMKFKNVEFLPEY